jgi:hypothetical protein
MGSHLLVHIVCLYDLIISCLSEILIVQGSLDSEDMIAENAITELQNQHHTFTAIGAMLPKTMHKMQSKENLFGYWSEIYYPACGLVALRASINVFYKYTASLSSSKEPFLYQTGDFPALFSPSFPVISPQHVSHAFRRDGLAESGW